MGCSTAGGSSLLGKLKYEPALDWNLPSPSRSDWNSLIFWTPTIFPIEGTRSIRRVVFDDDDKAGSGVGTESFIITALRQQSLSAVSQLSHPFGFR